MKSQAPVKEQSTIQVLKASECSSISGRSNLSYSIGSDAQKKVFIRITENTGAGLFSKEWTAIVLPDDKAITSGTLNSLFKGKSVNTAGFLLAVLIHEGVIKIVNEKPRKYERNDPDDFNKWIQSVMSSEIPPVDQKKSPKEKKRAEETNSDSQEAVC